MEDKEAQEKIAQSLDTVGEMLADKHLDSMTREALAQLTLRELEELGYRKLPKDKPPLLSDREINQAYLSNVHGIRRRGSRLNKVAQAQREADIKHYEG